jgi:hypothetical protein
MEAGSFRDEQQCSVESNAIDGVYGKLEVLHEGTCGSAGGGGCALRAHVPLVSGELLLSIVQQQQQQQRRGIEEQSSSTT